MLGLIALALLLLVFYVMIFGIDTLVLTLVSIVFGLGAWFILVNYAGKFDAFLNGLMI